MAAIWTTVVEAARHSKDATRAAFDLDTGESDHRPGAVALTDTVAACERLRGSVGRGTPIRANGASPAAISHSRSRDAVPSSRARSRKASHRPPQPHGTGRRLRAPLVRRRRRTRRLEAPQGVRAYSFVPIRGRAVGAPVAGGGRRSPRRAVGIGQPSPSPSTPYAAEVAGKHCIRPTTPAPRLWPRSISIARSCGSVSSTCSAVMRRSLSSRRLRPRRKSSRRRRNASLSGRSSRRSRHSKLNTVRYLQMTWSLEASIARASAAGDRPPDRLDEALDLLEGPRRFNVSHIRPPLGAMEASGRRSTRATTCEWTGCSAMHLDRRHSAKHRFSPDRRNALPRSRAPASALPHCLRTHRRRGSTPPFAPLHVPLVGT